MLVFGGIWWFLTYLQARFGSNGVKTPAVLDCEPVSVSGER